MKKVSIFILFILLYLGVSKSFSKEEKAIKYINKQQDLKSTIKHIPVSIILREIYSRGIIIKTHYLKLQFIYGFNQSEEVIFKTKNNFLLKIKPFLNHSIFRLDSNQDSQESYIPLPIGSFYIGNNSFGYWSSRNKDEKRWRFFNAHVALKSSLKLKRENYLYSNFKHLQFIKNNFKKYLLNISKKKSTITKTSSKNSQKEIINISNIKKQLSYLWTFSNNLQKRKMNHE